MKEKEITVLKVSPLEKPCRCKLKNNLDDLQRAVSLEAEHTGLIEIIEIGSELGYLGERVCLLCNEEGKLINLPLTAELVTILSAELFISPDKTRMGIWIHYPKKLHSTT